MADVGYNGQRHEGDISAAASGRRELKRPTSSSSLWLRVPGPAVVDYAMI